MIPKLIVAIVLGLLSHCVGAQSPSDQSQRKIALSFDDAPLRDGPVFSGAERTDALIEALAASDVPPSVFFITTRGLDSVEGRSRVVAYANAGQLIANHSHTHPLASRVGLEEIVSEIDQAEGNLSGYANPRPWFRFPSLDEGSTPELRDGIRLALSERGLFNAYVTVDNFDCYMDRQLAKALRDGRTVNMDALKAAYVDMLLEAVTFFDNVSIESFWRDCTACLVAARERSGRSFCG